MTNLSFYKSLNSVKYAGTEICKSPCKSYDRRIPSNKAPFNSHGQEVFFDGRNYITRDVDSHIGGKWKMFDRKGNRIGTFDKDLNQIGK